MTLYGIDAASFQGDVSWGPVDASTAFGWEKVTQGTGYVNPRWAPERGEMAARAGASGFIPGGYLFLEQGNGAGQADFFHRVAGSLAGFALAVDIEPSTTRPDMATARACVARLRALYPGHRIGGYIPHWYWGGQDTTFVDYLWASNYVTGGPASPEWLYSRVTPAQWAGYGGSSVSLLQFTDKAQVPGVAGPCDCSAFRGDAAQLRHLLLGTKVQAPPVSKPEAELMQPAYLEKGAGAKTPIVVPAGAKRVRFFSHRPATIHIDLIDAPQPATDDLVLGYDVGAKQIMLGAALALVVTRSDAGADEVSFVASA